MAYLSGSVKIPMKAVENMAAVAPELLGMPLEQVQAVVEYVRRQGLAGEAFAAPGCCAVASGAEGSLTQCLLAALAAMLAAMRKRALALPTYLYSFNCALHLGRCSKCSIKLVPPIYSPPLHATVL